MKAELVQEFEVFKRELLLAPRQVRVRLLEYIEETIAEIVPGKTYPFDYLVYRITDHRTEASTPLILQAEQATVELARLLYEVGRSLPVSAESIPEKVLTLGQLAERWKVSPAVVLRWRREGLALRLFRFDRGRRKAGLRESLAATFERDRARLIRHARSRRRVSEGERNVIIEEALVGLAREEPPGRILAHLSERFVLSQAALERVITAAARENQLLKAFARGSMSRQESESIFREYTSGGDIEEIAKRHGRSTDRIRRIVVRGRVRRVLKRPVRFIKSDEFEAEDAAEKILTSPHLEKRNDDEAVSSSDLPVYLKGIAGMPLLTREEEAALFRKYNYLKHLASGARKQLDIRCVDMEILQRVERLLGEADAVRERLVRSNLRLVASIARRHYGRGASGPYLISEGNMALLDAVEAFDYSRGNRFSTYAGWAIVRRFARMIPEKGLRMASVEEEILEATAKVEVDYTALKPAAIAEGISRALSGLSDRERVVLESRFGLGEVRKPRTLAELGAIFGVTKERIRQIEVQALSRLRRIVENSCPDIIPG